MEGSCGLVQGRMGGIEREREGKEWTEREKARREWLEGERKGENLQGRKVEMNEEIEKGRIRISKSFETNERERERSG